MKTFTRNNRMTYSAGALGFILALFLLFGQAAIATAHTLDPDCDAAGIGIAIRGEYQGTNTEAAYAYDETNPFGPSTVDYKVTVELSNTQCPISDGEPELVLPDGTVIDLDDSLELARGESITYDVTGTPYIVDSADLGSLAGADPDEVRATAHVDAISHRATGLDQDVNAGTNYDILVINPDTTVDISASASSVYAGDTVDLTITEENTGDVDLENVSVDVDNGVGTLSAPPDAGDDGDGVLEVGETWTWNVNGVVVAGNTTFTATGHGEDPLGNDITFDNGFATEQDSVTVTTLSPSTIVTIGASAETIYVGSTIDITVTEENDGDVDLENPSVNLSTGGGGTNLVAPPDSGDDGDGVLEVGETWSWTVSGVTVSEDTTFTATGHGTDPSGNDVTWCEDPETPEQGVFCDQDEQDSVRVLAIDPSTIVAITASESIVDVGNTVDLTVTEENDGDHDLTNVSVVVNDGTSDIATLVTAPDSGDDGDGVLEVGETWSWTIANVVVNNDTTFTATGHGETTLGDDVTWTDGCEAQDPEEGIYCDADEQDAVSVEVRYNPSTEVSAEVDIDLVYEGDEVTLTITETNDGDAPLTDAYVDLAPLGVTLDESHADFSSDGNNDSTLDVGETWTWVITDNPTSDTTYVAIGHGTDPDGNDVTWCEDVENPGEGIVCDQDERDEVSVDVISPSTVLNVSASELEVSTGDTVTLTVTEENDGDVELTDPYIEIDNGVGTFDETSSEFVGTDDGDDGVLSPGEVWEWEIEVTIDADTTFEVIGHGTDPLGTDITYPFDEDERSEVTITTVGMAGCTPGFWKTHPDEAVWGPTGLAPEDLFDTVFGVDVTLLWSEKGKPADTPDATLLQALDASGGGINALARHATAALLNALHGDIDYPMSDSAIIDAVQDAVANEDYNSLKDQLAEYNELGCSINAHGEPTDEE